MLYSPRLFLTLEELKVANLEDVAAPMKWGFLADNIVSFCRYHRLADHVVDSCTSHRLGAPLDRKWQNVDLAQGVVDFLSSALEGVENYGRLNFPAGIGSVVESLTLYGWAAEALRISPEDKGKSKEAIVALLCICRKWQRDELLGEEDVSKLEDFFSSISRITLREANKGLGI